MKCFNHNETDAIGQCKHCYKGLCKACLTDLGHGTACQDKHEVEVENINSLIENSTASYSLSPKSVFVSNLFLLLLGILFLWFGFAEDSTFLMVVGALFISYLVLLLIYNIVQFRKLKTDMVIKQTENGSDS